jgi:hypothetical protein
MIKHLQLFLFFLFPLFTGCETSPPVQPDITPQQTGKIFVESNVDSARILVDNSFTNKFTPDTITVTAGNRVITLEKDGYITSSVSVLINPDEIKNINISLTAITFQKIVLLEDFANVSCTPCVTSNLILHALSKSYGSGKLVIIKYPTNFPSPNDPFYFANKPDSDARMKFYNIINAPTAIVDGFLRPSPQDSNSIKVRIDERLALEPKFNLTVSDTISGGNYRVFSSIEAVDTTGLDFSRLVMHTVVIEREIEFATPPGSNGETKFYEVMRAMLPSNEGEPLNNLQLNQPLSFNREVSLNPVWSQDQLSVIIFVQDKITREVYQAVSTIK